MSKSKKPASPAVTEENITKPEDVNGLVVNNLGEENNEEAKAEEPVIVSEDPTEPVVQPEPKPVVFNVNDIIPSHQEEEYRMESDVSLPIGLRIVAFLKNRGSRGGWVKINDFVKSLYPLGVPGAPPEWSKQGSTKFLKHTLDKLIEEGRIQINNDAHKQLGTTYYSGEEQYAKTRNISNVILEAKIFG